MNPNVSLQVPPNVLLMTPAQQTAWAYANLRLVLRNGYQLQPGYDPNANPGFIYDPATGQLGFQYQMPQSVLSALDKTAIPILQLDPVGNVVIERGADGKYYFATTTASFVSPSSLEALYTQSLNSVKDAQASPPASKSAARDNSTLTRRRWIWAAAAVLFPGGSVLPITPSTMRPWLPGHLPGRQ